MPSKKGQNRTAHLANHRGKFPHSEGGLKSTLGGVLPSSPLKEMASGKRISTADLNQPLILSYGSGID